MYRRVFVIVLLASVCSTLLHSATFNVTTTAEFQTALTTSQANGESDTINVAAGTYNISSSLTYSAAENFNLSIVGAGSSSTILDGGNSVQIMRLVNDGTGDVNVSGLTFQHGRVNSLAEFGAGLFVNSARSGSITVDQCVATNCTAIRNTAGAWLGTSDGDITVTNSSFTYNECDDRTSDDGCGLYLYFDSATATGNAVVRNNNISHNTLNTNPSPVGNCDGAGLMIYHLGTSGTAPTITVEGNTINDNLTYEGASGASFHILHQETVFIMTGNTFSGNVAGPVPSGIPIQIFGGGAHVYLDGGYVTITDNLFLNNRNLDPYGEGAGLCLDNLPSGSLRMSGNVFAGNQCSGLGGGALVNPGSRVSGAEIVGNLFVNNQAGLSEGSGGGLSIAAGTDVNLTNNTFYNNAASSGAGLGYYTESSSNVASIRNSIFWGNSPDSIGVFGPASSVQATYSNIGGGTGESYFGTGCVDSDPLFFDTSSPQGADGIYATIDDGLHLTASSPSMNTGSNSLVPAWLTVDLAGQSRIQETTVDMGAYEGTAGEPVTYNLTMAVSPASSGTTTPTEGTHEVGSSQSIIATAATGYTFASWSVTANATVADSTSSSTTVSLAGDATVTANFEMIPPNADLTMAISPEAGGSINPVAGTYTVDTQVAQTITATAAEGYNFTSWTYTGRVVIGSATSASTTATLTGDATVTANFSEIPDTVNFMFIHHSVGQNWLDNSLRDALSAKSFIDEVNEITYGDSVSPDSGRPASLGDTAGDNTDMNMWLYWFNDYLGSVETFECSSGTNGIIMFKSCFPNSHITEEGSGNGDPFDATRSIVNYQSIFRNAAGAGTAYTSSGYNYHALEDVFAANPDLLFIYVTAPPECYSEATAATGAYAREFNDWLKETWLPSYNTNHPGLNNVQIFDFFDVLANADTGATYSNMLKAAYGGDTGDSHPNDTANTAATQIFASNTTNFIDLVFARFTGSATQFSLTTAVSPTDGGTTVPAAGTIDSFTPMVLSATAADGYRFVNWTISENGLVYNISSHLTTLLMSGATTVTANFASVPYMTIGSVADFTVDDLIDFPGTEFGGKPSAYATYTDPIPRDPANPKLKKSSLKTSFGQSHSDEFTAEWTKKQVLYDQRNISRETDSETYLAENPIVDLICNLYVKARDENRESGTFSAGQIYLTPPRITDIQDSSGTSIDTASPGDTIYLIGDYFGTKPPKVWFESDSNGRVKQTKCKVDKKHFSRDYLDSKGKPSCMDCETGDSMVPVILPTRLPDDGFFDFIVIDNGIGRDTFEFSVE